MRKFRLISLILSCIVIAGIGPIRAGSSIRINAIDSVKEYPVVRVDLSVWGETDISQKNLAIIEDGKNIDTFSITRGQSDKDTVYLVVSIDSSRSIRNKDLEQIKKTSIDLIESLPDAVIALYRFDDDVILIENFTNANTIGGKIDEISRKGKKTLLYEAVYDGIKHLVKEGGVSKSLVVFTDGKDEGSGLTEGDIIDLAVKEGISLHFLAVGEKKSIGSIKRIARLTGGSFTDLRHDGGVKRLVTDISKKEYRRYTISYKSLSLGNSAHTLEVQLRSVDLKGKDMARFEVRAVNEMSVNPVLIVAICGVVIGLIIVGLLLVIIFRGQRLKKKTIEADKDEKVSNIVIPEMYDPQEEKTLRSGDEPYKYCRSWLTQKDGPEIGKKFPIYWDEVTIGRGRKCSLVINDISVSSMHSRIRFVRGHFYLFDLASDNGTFLNGNKILRPRILNDWDEIRIGNTTFIFRGIYDRV
jgi:hypothetical protein